MKRWIPILFAALSLAFAQADATKAGKADSPDRNTAKDKLMKLPGFARQK